MRLPICLLVLLVALASGCATLERDYPSPAAHSVATPQQSLLGRAHAPVVAANAPRSGYALINNGVRALATRAALADLAERELDVQYYIWDRDEIGIVLMDRVLAAADRGVRVRILLDDYLVAWDDATLKALDRHPNVSVRVFNPYPGRARWTRTLQMLGNLDTLGRRMHNKSFIVDGQVAVLGGRNIADHYFENSDESNFRDIDVLLTGPAAQQAARNFDTYWNSPIVVPAGAYPGEPDAQAVARLRGEAAALRAKADGPAATYERAKDEEKRRIVSTAPFQWATAFAVAEPPERIDAESGQGSSAIAREHAVRRQATTKEMVVEAAYFVPGERGVELLGALVKRGVRVRILTNSLSSTDVIAVHAGYQRYRAPLLAAGIELHEYRVDAPRPSPGWGKFRVGASTSALHAKSVIYDRRWVWIGSANFDPRSRHLNNETGVMIDAPELAERLLASAEIDFSDKNSWRLSLADPKDPAQGLRWHGLVGGQAAVLDDEPDSGFGRKLELFFYGLIPGLEDLL